MRPGVSTDRRSEGNRELVRSVLKANYQEPYDHIFLDLNAVNDKEIGDGGRYHDNFFLIPHGLVYRVVRLEEGDVMSSNGEGGLWEEWKSSTHHLHQTRELLGPYLTSPHVLRNLREGSWERGVFVTFYDSLYHLCLSQLTHIMALQNEGLLTTNNFIITSSTLFEACAGMDEVVKRGINSIARYDLIKNRALCFMRLQV